ncbi:hypothetical protein [Salipiger aestuarii]|uniref:Uncharacterized protein n=1 Tax=Salipiger aestuarii TaxID=568098 RepID=A0A327XSG2_9RHOB|nr:hypothetical protein [Salipiger aestuarii]EIE51061.1 hypothetical protein C357_10542 [Citreicella sp. 357]KAA8608624.1 hypothetical protein AL037_16650 [Salipiger aestuarii]KAB2540652.1 hypothetical protein AL035_16610 [Salipiger aestuarii]RAK11660.1 hypothetical protein ATI53_104831 [Salipiger aestuarii]
MLWELIAVFVAGFAGAGIMLALVKATGNRLPRWLVPVAAGAAMLAASIASEYGWYDRTEAALPDGFAAVTANESRAFWRPWTYVVPMVDRFIAVDLDHPAANAQTEGLYMVRAAFYGRWRPTSEAQIMVDCTRGRTAIPSGDAGTPVWRTDPQDPILAAVCTQEGMG